MGEVLPYLEVRKSEQEQETEKLVMPSVVGLTKNEVKKVMEEKNLIIEFNETENTSDESKVLKQVPEAGIMVEVGSRVILYVE